MMILPPIDNLLKKMDGNKYVLAIVAAKEAKAIESRPGMKEQLATADKKSITLALEEIENGLIVSNNVFDDEE